MDALDRRFEDEFEQEFLALSQGVQDELLASRFGLPIFHTVTARCEDLRKRGTSSSWICISIASA
jgi:hypothetical protein